MLKEIQVPIEDLLLDPNNPRFSNDFVERAKVPDQDIESQQENILKRFRDPGPDDADFDVTNIKDLYQSMLRIGFVGIDRVVVRTLENSTNKYLVLEGNRRIATVKCLIRDYKNRVSPLDHPTKGRKDFETHESSFKTITTMLLDVQGLSRDEIDHQVAVILGIRHHGSLLEWDLLPKAFNIYSEYMEEEPIQETFRFVHNKAKSVASRLCIETHAVTRALKTYQAFLQARDRFPEVQNDDFSLIEYGVQDRHLNRGYFNIDENTFELDEPSLTKLNLLCQFATRRTKTLEHKTSNGKKKIIPDPKHFKLLGRLIEKMRHANHPAVKAYAADLIQGVEDENNLEMTLDHAIDSLTDFENRTEWFLKISDLLDKQVELDIETYAGEGLDRGRKDELKATLERLRSIMNI
jgi:hypothetical protein